MEGTTTPVYHEDTLVGSVKSIEFRGEVIIASNINNYVSQHRVPTEFRGRRLPLVGLRTALAHHRAVLKAQKSVTDVILRSCDDY